MKRIARTLGPGIALVAALATMAAVRAPDAGRVDGARLTQPGTDDWPGYGRSYAETRFSPLTQIDTSTIGKLSLAWAVDLDTHRGQEATPIVVDGVMYVSTAWSKVMALDAATGRVLWTFDPHVIGGKAVHACCDVVNRGVAVWKGKVLFGTIDGRLIALDAATGKQVWSVVTVDQSKPYTITGAPRVFKDKVVIGNSGAELGVRGYVTAYDIATGKQVWRFYTVPGNPADGPDHAASDDVLARLASPTWHGEWWKYGGGGTVWDSIVYDPELDQLLLGVGNGSPWNHVLRSDGKGDNLFLSSILAINPDTGRLKWYYQTTPKDNFDFTATQHIILTDLKIDGKVRKVLMQAPKNGFYYVIDRVTGKLLSADNYVPVRWASKIDLKTGQPVRNESSFYDDTKDALVNPWMGGGHNWHPMSYSPKTGLTYIPAQRVWWRYSANQPMQFDEMAKDFDKTVGKQKLLPTIGVLTAWDPVKKKIAWKVEQSTLFNGGTLATAGDLVFQGTSTGKFAAYDARDGKLLKTIDTGTGIIAAPITYRLDGVQYVAVLAGMGGATMMMLDKDAVTRTRENEGRLLVFKLGGGPVKKPPLRTEPLGAGPDAKVRAVPSPQVARGIDLYRANCGRCHGMLTSTSMLPDLRRMRPEVRDNFDAIVRDGAMKDGGMIGFGDKLPKADTDAIKAALVWLGDKDPAQFADPKVYPMRTQR